MKRTIRFVLGVERAKVDVEIRPMQNAATARTVDLTPCPADARELSISGSFGGGGGQVCDHIANAAADHDAPDVARLCQIWERWHLNGMNGGTRTQREVLADAPIDRPGYDYAKAFLAERGLDPDMTTAPERVQDGHGNIIVKGYAYGSAWLADPLPADIEAELMRLCDRIDGQRYGAEMTRDDLADVDEINENADTLDSREIFARLEALESFLADLPEDQRTTATYDPESDVGGSREDEVAEYEQLKALDDAGSSYADDWQYGETLIADSYFEDYAEQLAKDLGMIKEGAAWPSNCIDWEAAADQLKIDYTAIEFRGRTFWVR